MQLNVLGTKLFYKNNVLNAKLTQLGAASILLSVWGLAFHGTEKWSVPTFAWHPILNTLGIFALVQSLLILQPTKDILDKKVGLQWHQILILSASLPLITLGSGVMWYLHDLPGKQHFISWHGILGVAIVTLLWAQVLFGATTVYWKRFFYGTESRAKSMWKYHRLSGYTLCMLLFVELILAFWEVKWMQNAGSVSLVIFTTAMTGLMAYGIATRIDTSKWGLR